MTDAQDAMIEGLCERLGLTDAALDAYLCRVFGVELDDLDAEEASLLIDTLIGWAGEPAGVPA